MIELSIADLIFNQVLCVHPAKLEMVLSVLSKRLNIASAAGFNLDAALAYSGDDAWRVMAGPKGPGVAADSQRWQDLGNGVALLPVSGSLVPRTRGIDAMSGLQSYRQIGADFGALMADSSVNHIVLQEDTPGGSVNTLPDLVDQIYAARGVKPVTALVDDSAYSAGYWLAAAAEDVVVSRTSGVGSIGAMAVHVDRSKANEAAGVKVTAITSGKKKAMLSGDQPLSDEAQAELQGMVDEMGAMFIDGVAHMRGLSAKAVKAMEAGLFVGAHAVEAGLADRVMSAGDALAEIVGRYQIKPGAGPGHAPAAGRVQRAAKAMAMRSAG
jgi:signal peptide peptidase SppA